MAEEYIGIDIGGTKCAVVKGDKVNGVTKKIRFETVSVNETLDKIMSAVEEMMPAKAIGISCGGPLDERRGIIMSPPNLPGWDNIHITELISERFGIPCRLCNDANACALAEWKFGAGMGYQNMVFLTFGTGLGAGIIADGRLISGANGNAGEVGHIRLADDGPIGYGKAGSFEGFCSGGGIAKLARSMASDALRLGAPLSFGKDEEEINSITTKSLAELAKSGNEDAIRVFDLSAARLGQGLSIIIDILNPEAIVIGSVYARSEELFRGAFEVIEKEALAESRSICKILPARLGDSIGDVAALAVAMEA
jgi:glucokinase